MNQRNARHDVMLALIAAGFAIGLHVQTAAPPLAVPTEPVSAILKAFETHDIVAVSDMHGNDQAHALRLALIRNPRFAATVNDIVVESGNSLYQELMDRFIDGKDVPYESLRQVWHKTTVLSGVWDRPMYEEVFRTVRAVNALLPQSRRLRVLLGDPPIEWDRLPVNYQAMVGQRESYPAEVIRREVLTKQHRALVIYGGFHLLRKGDGSLPTRPLRETLVGRLERMGARVFAIWLGPSSALQRLQADAAWWPAPSFASIAGTVMGNANYSLIGGPVYDINPFAVRADGTPLRMEDQYDAVVSLGWNLTSGPASPPPQELIDRLK